MESQFIELRNQIAEYKATKRYKWQRVPEEIKNKLRELHNSGNYKIKHLAEEFGFSNSLLTKWVKPEVEKKDNNFLRVSVSEKADISSALYQQKILQRKALRAVLSNGVVIFGLSFEQILLLNRLD